MAVDYTFFANRDVTPTL